MRAQNLFSAACLSASLFSGAIVVSAMLAFAPPATADLFITQENPGQVIAAKDRIILRDFLGREQDAACSSANADSKFRPEPCGMPGRVVRYYPPGQVLPDTMIYDSLPQYVESRLTPPANGEAYVFAGDNVYLMDAMTHRVIDSVSIASE